MAHPLKKIVAETMAHLAGEVSVHVRSRDLRAIGIQVPEAKKVQVDKSRETGIEIPDKFSGVCVVEDLREAGVDVPKGFDGDREVRIRVRELRDALDVPHPQNELEQDGSGYFDEDGEPFEFTCPDCGGEHFGRDPVTDSPGRFTTVCLTDDCGYAAEDSEQAIDVT